MPDEDMHHLDGERITIRSDIDYRVIDTVNLASNLKERLERRKSWGKAYWGFRGSFYSLFLISKAYLSSKYSNQRKEMEKKFYSSDGTVRPHNLIADFDDYLTILKESGLIELGQHESSIR